MPTTSDKPLTLTQAARTLFRTGSPSQEQVQRVYELMKAGALPVDDYGISPLTWTTTEAALADFLAAQQMLKARAQRGGAAPAAIGANETLVRWTAAHQDESAKMHDVYRHIWRDYFLAVMLRRRMAHRSAAFHRAVLVGQIVLLLALVALFLSGVRRFSSWQQPAEHVAVERWIDEHTDEFRVTRWHTSQPSADGSGVEVRVEYHYRQESPRWIQTDRTFNTNGELVTELSP